MAEPPPQWRLIACFPHCQYSLEKQTEVVDSSLKNVLVRAYWNCIAQYFCSGPL